MRGTVAAAVLFVTAPSVAGELDRIESAHRPQEATASPPPTRSSSTTSPTSTTSATASRRANEHSFSGPCLILGPWTGYCLYGTSWLRAERGGAPESLAARVLPTKDFVGRPIGVDGESLGAAEAEVMTVTREPDPRRYGEVHASTFAEAGDGIWGFDFGARGWLWVGGIDFQWLRLHEPGNALDHLDLLRPSIVGAFFALRHVEAHALVGVDLLHGRDWTPAFGPGLEVRTYPWTRITIAGAARVSIFADGYPLLDSRIDAGLALGRIDLLLGCRWIYQAYRQESPTSIVGPSASVLVRLGP